MGYQNLLLHLLVFLAQFQWFLVTTSSNKPFRALPQYQESPLNCFWIAMAHTMAEMMNILH